MPYFAATSMRAFTTVQHGKQEIPRQHGMHPPRPAFSRAAPQMHGEPTGRRQELAAAAAAAVLDRAAEQPQISDAHWFAAAMRW